MNENQGDRDATDSEQTTPTEAADAEAAAPAEKKSKPARSRSGRLALLLSVLALGLAGWMFYEHYFDQVILPDSAPEAASAQELSALDGRLDELSERVSEFAALGEEQQQRLRDQQDSLTEQVERLGTRIGDLESRLQSQFERRLDQVEDELGRQARQWSDDLAALEGQLGQAVDAWEIRGDEERQVERDLLRHIAMLEAAALLRIGQERAELGADLRGARLAYRRAEQLLDRVDDVRLDRVQRLIAQELEAMERLPGVDLGRALARLDRLARDSRGWPTLVGQETREPVRRGEEDEPEHWRERLSGAARSLVRVQARDDLGRTQEQFEMSRDMLQLRLVAAQLALSRRDETSFGLQLGAAVDLLDEWFDTSADAVAQARAELVELSELSFEPELPELGEALDRLQTLLGGS